MQHLKVTFSPDEPPTVHLRPFAHGGHAITLAFGSLTTVAATDVRLSLSGHPDPAGYLRDVASICLGLAERVEALPQEVTA